MAFVVSHNITSPLGNTSAENYKAVVEGRTAVQQVTRPDLLPDPFYAALFPLSKPLTNTSLTRFERWCVQSVNEALQSVEGTINKDDILFILSTTKGNIELIEQQEVDEALRKRISLQSSAQKIADSLGIQNPPLVVSNACISGVMAISVAKRMLDAGKYKHVIVTGADVLSHFILSGFQALSAMSATPCRPFDKERNGINLGECVATIILSRENIGNAAVFVHDGAISNDANHISGPSRTGEELAQAINTAMRNAGVSPADLAFVSAHGTATIFNDEMEAKAFSLSGLSAVPVHSLKPHYGHTLGAAGVLESVLSCLSLQNGVVLPSSNFNEAGVSQPINVSRNLSTSSKQHALKTASGFGGCNAAIIFSKS